MIRLLEPFLGNLLLSAVIFVVLFFVIALLIARKDLPGLVGGIARSIASYFSGPFVYLKRSAGDLARYAQQGESRFAASDQYLLNKLLLMLSAAIFLVAIGILTVGALQGTLHAREWSRLNRRAGESARELDLARQEKTRLEAHVARLEDEWTHQRSRLVAAYMKQRDQKADSMSAANQRLERQAVKAFESDASAATLFQSILSYMASNSENPTWMWRQVRDRIQSAINSSAATPEHKELMHRHNENWFQIRMTLVSPAELGEHELRAVVQPTLRDSISRVEFLGESIPQQEASLAELRVRAKSEARGIAWEPLKAFLKFVTFVWGAGLALEALALAVLTAGNIRRLRERSDGIAPAPVAE